ncbi:hypothetical protein P154DRAFT_581658 [Amniculicola lignicola CBS 123094]|uniref:Uncharacterized protein n=1 Tax=Amniculicola lignicola CBS 123094 TaxID=1392246 RepID=A0A6A5WAH6_9PLEO|nr:hypothetical protein P154DRAFT_581658 [Amniculicola lignicola CBS 123094]
MAFARKKFKPTSYDFGRAAGVADALSEHSLLKALMGISGSRASLSLSLSPIILGHRLLSLGAKASIAGALSQWRVDISTLLQTQSTGKCNSNSGEQRIERKMRRPYARPGPGYWAERTAWLLCDVRCARMGRTQPQSAPDSLHTRSSGVHPHSSGAQAWTWFLLANITGAKVISTATQIFQRRLAVMEKRRSTLTALHPEMPTVKSK